MSRSGLITSLRGLGAARVPARATGGAARALGGPRSALILGASALGCAALALAPGGAGPVSARAGLAAVAEAVGWCLVRRRAAPAAPPAVRVTALVPIGRSGELALVEVDGRRFLVAGGERPLALLAELPPGPERAP